MIQIKELRIGNLVTPDNKDETQKQYKVEPHHFTDCCLEDKFFADPILITEEWLEQFEFRKIADYLFCLDEFLTLEVEDGDWKNLCLDVYIENATTVHPVYITCLSYVHQLQNLYFALTGKELEIQK